MRSLILLLWLALWAALALLETDPINRTSLRLGIVLDLVSLWAVSLWLAWRRRPARLALLLLPCLGLAPLLGEPPAGDSSQLRAAYQRALVSYEGTPYLWGGQSRRAIDCSGFVEKAMIDALLVCGRPREALELWWHRASARALRDEYRGFTVRRLWSRRLGDVSDEQLQAGDLMVPEDGEHVMAYLGQGTWIEASPTEGKVVRSPQSFRLQHPAYILRWSWLR